MSTPEPFTRRRLAIFVVLAFTPAVLAIGWYSIRRQNQQQALRLRLTPRGVEILRRAESVTAYHLGMDDAQDTSGTIAGQPIVGVSPNLDGYYVMRLRKAMFANGNTSDDRPPCSGSPQLAFQLSDETSTYTVLLNLVCRSLQVVETDRTGRAISEGRASLSQIGVDQIRFLEAGSVSAAITLVFIGLVMNPTWYERLRWCEV